MTKRQRSEDTQMMVITWHNEHGHVEDVTKTKLSNLTDDQIAKILLLNNKSEFSEEFDVLLGELDQQNLFFPDPESGSADMNPIWEIVPDGQPLTMGPDEWAELQHIVHLYRF